jgi:hypothetical protein
LIFVHLSGIHVVAAPTIFIWCRFKGVEMSGTGKIGMIAVTLCVLLLSVACASNAEQAVPIPPDSEFLHLSPDAFPGLLQIEIIQAENAWESKLAFRITNVFDKRAIIRIAIIGNEVMEVKGFTGFPKKSNKSLIWYVSLKPGETVDINGMSEITERGKKMLENRGDSALGVTFEVSIHFIDEFQLKNS